MFSIGKSAERCGLCAHLTPIYCTLDKTDNAGHVPDKSARNPHPDKADKTL